MLGNREGRKKLFAHQEEVFFSELSEEIKEAEETNPDFEPTGVMGSEQWKN